MVAANTYVSNLEILCLTLTFSVILPLIFNLLIHLTHYLNDAQETFSMVFGIFDYTNFTNPDTYRRYFQRFKNYSALFGRTCQQTFTAIASATRELWPDITEDSDEQNANETGLQFGQGQEGSGQENLGDSTLQEHNSSAARSSNTRRQQMNNSRNVTETSQDHSSEHEAQRLNEGSTSTDQRRRSVEWYGDNIERERLARGENLAECERYGRSKNFLNPSR